ncbi:MAG: peptide chain release factor N(5)-glutamine methyltransferase, partial [Alphaproteobacteria bacterium]
IPELPPEISRHEPKAALDGGSDGLAALRAVLKVGRRRLRAGGRLFVEIGADQGDAAAELARAAGLDDVRIHVDLARRPRVVTGRWPGPS